MKAGASELTAMRLAAGGGAGGCSGGASTTSVGTATVGVASLLDADAPIAAAIAATSSCALGEEASPLHPANASAVVPPSSAGGWLKSMLTDTRMPRSKP